MCAPARVRGRRCARVEICDLGFQAFQRFHLEEECVDYQLVMETQFPEALGRGFPTPESRFLIIGIWFFIKFIA
jgi:hypothetical protein